MGDPIGKESEWELTIRGLMACGWMTPLDSGSTKYLSFARPGCDQRLFVGKSGALRWSMTGKVSNSQSMTGGKRHRAYRELGSPTYRFESVEQAQKVYHEILGE